MEVFSWQKVPLNGAYVSMQGGRPENQDDVGWIETPLGFLLLVCDGMGGGPGGKTASNITKTEIARGLMTCAPTMSVEQAIRQAVAKAQDALEAAQADNPALQGMGSTFVAILINSQAAYVAHAGDSRCYRLRGRRCLYRTKDHSLVSELVDKKAMTVEQARVSPQSNVITRGLGATSNHVPEIDIVPFRKGDRFVLCTDGVWGAMPEKMLRQRLEVRTDSQTTVTNLSAEIDQIGFSHGGGHDNHTLAIIDIGADSVVKDKLPYKLIGLLALCSIVVLCIVSGLFLLFSRLIREKTMSDNNNVSANDYYSPRSEGQTTTTTFSQGGTFLDLGDTSKMVKAKRDSVLNRIRDSVSQKSANSDSGKKTANQGKETHAKQKDNAPDKSAKSEKQSPSIAKAIKTVEKIVEFYKRASALTGKEKDVKKRAGGLQINIIDSLKKLDKQVPKLQSEVKSIYDCAKDSSLDKFVDKPDTHGNSKLTPKGTKFIGRQVEKLNKLSKSLKSTN